MTRHAIVIIIILPFKKQWIPIRRWGYTALFPFPTLQKLKWGYNGVKSSQSLHLRSLSSHFILIFFLFPQLKTVNLHFFTPVISLTLNFFTHKNPNPQSSKKTSTPPKMIHQSAQGYSHHNHQDGLIQHDILYGQKHKQLSSHMHREDNS